MRPPQKAGGNRPTGGRTRPIPGFNEAPAKGGGGIGQTAGFGVEVKATSMRPPQKAGGNATMRHRASLLVVLQ